MTEDPTAAALTDVDIEGLATELAGAMPDLDPDRQRVAVALYRAVAAGEPVSHDALAAQTGLPAELVAEAVESWPGVYRDDRGRAVAFWGLAQPEMPHRFETGGPTLYTWCAWDALFIPGILGAEARVESRCPVTGETIRLTVAPDGVREVSPVSAVLSMMRPAGGFDQDVIKGFCHYVLFFADAEAGREWTRTHAGTFLISIEEGFKLGQLTNRANYGEAL